MSMLFDSFPREVGCPERRLCKTEKEFCDFINRFNGKTDLYYSLYNCDENRNFDNLVLNKIGFDIDIKDGYSYQDVLSDAKKMSDYFMSKKLEHSIFFSGNKGIHLYVWTKTDKNIVNKKECLKNAHIYFRDLLTVTLDESIFGDIKRLFRIPNTLHLTSRLFCINLERSDLDKGIEFIREKAKQQCFQTHVYGSELFDISKFDTEKKKIVDRIPQFSAAEIKVDDKIIDGFLPCVKAWLVNLEHPITKQRMGTWEARYYFAVYCKETGISAKIANEIAQKYFGKIKRTDRFGNNYNHFSHVKALQLAYARDDFFPSCHVLFDKNACPGICDAFKKCGNWGSPIYHHQK